MKKDSENIRNIAFSSFLWKIFERFSAQMITFVVTILLARILSPTDYGLVAIVGVFVGIGNVFVVSGWGTALVQKKDADNIDFSTVFFFNVAFSTLVYMIIFATAPIIAQFYQEMALIPVLRALGLMIPVSAINSIQQAYVARKMLFKKFFFSTLFGTLLSGIVGIILAYCGAGIWALVAQQMVNTVVDTGILWFTVKWRPQFIFSVQRMRQLFSYGWRLLISSLLDVSYNNLQQLVIGKLYTSADLAYYNKGTEMPYMVIANVNASIDSILLPTMSGQQENPEMVKAITRRALQVSSYAVFPALIGLAAVAEPLVSILLTEKWLPCVPFLRIMCFSFALWPFHTANLNAIKAMGRSDVYFKIELIKKFFGIVVLIFVIPYGPLAMAASALFTGGISTYINAFPNKIILNYSYCEQVKDIFPTVVISFIMGVAVYFIGFLNFSTWAILLIQVPIGIILYLFLSIVTRNESTQYVLQLIKGIFNIGK